MALGLEEYPEFPPSSVTEENTQHQVGTKGDLIHVQKMSKSLENCQRSLHSKVLQVITNSK